MGRLTVIAIVVLVIVEFGNGMEICGMDSGELQQCLPAIRGPSPSAPNPGCCSTIRKADLLCLCSYRDSFLLPTFGVDPKLAMALPRECHLIPPPQCEGSMRALSLFNYVVNICLV
ncbi:hypothetical protein AMTRI_Chr10g5160 [Amborella trichopoda]